MYVFSKSFLTGIIFLALSSTTFGASKCEDVTSKSDIIVQNLVTELQQANIYTGDSTQYDVLVKFETTEPTLEEQKFLPGENLVQYRTRLIALQKQKVTKANEQLISFLANNPNLNIRFEGSANVIAAWNLKTNITDLTIFLNATEHEFLPQVTQVNANVHISLRN